MPLSYSNLKLEGFKFFSLFLQIHTHTQRERNTHSNINTFNHLNIKQTAQEVQITAYMWGHVVYLVKYLILGIVILSYENILPDTEHVKFQILTLKTNSFDRLWVLLS